MVTRIRVTSQIRRCRRQDEDCRSEQSALALEQDLRGEADSASLANVSHEQIIR